MKISTLQWASGIFCALLGAFVLVTPHQFLLPPYAALQPHLSLWGGMLVIGGAALIAVAALRPAPPLLWLAHLWAGSTITVLGWSFMQPRAWTAVSAYGLLGVGTMLAPALARRTAWRRSDLFATLLSMSGIANGAIIFLAPSVFVASIYNIVRPYLPVVGVLFLVGGLSLWLAQWWRFPPRAEWLAYAALSVPFLIFAGAIALPHLLWTGTAYYGGFGLLLLAMPWLKPRLNRIDPDSLQTQLALILTGVAALPLILAAALTTNQIEDNALAQAAIEQRVLGSTLAETASDYLVLHRAAIQTLATDPALLDLPIAAQRARLQRFAANYPALRRVHIVGANGVALAQTDAPTIPLDFATVLGTLQQQPIMLFTAPAAPQPLILLGAPIPPTAGMSGGMLVGEIEASQLLTVLARPVQGARRRIVVVYQTVALTVSPTQPVVVLDPASLPLALIPPRTEGSTRYTTGDGLQIVGFAPVPNTAWTVIVERPRTDALATIIEGRNLTMIVLVLMMAGAAVLGIVVSRNLIGPLGNLGRALESLTEESGELVLPRSTVSEMAQLVATIGNLRTRLVQRTSERERAEQRLRFLAATSEQLSASLEYDTTLQTVAQLTVPALGDWCFVDILDAKGELKRSAIYHRDSAKVAQARANEERFPIGRNTAGGVFTVMRTRQPRLIEALSDAAIQAIAHEPDHVTSLQEYAGMSYMVVPLLARERILGVLTVMKVPTDGYYTPADLALTEEVGRRAAVALENARLYHTAQEAIKAREVFLSIASHELKTPLTSLLGFADLLYRRMHKTGTAEARDLRSIKMVTEQAQRLSRMINSLLDLSRIDSGQLSIERDPVDLQALTERLVYETQPLLENHTVTLSSDGTPLIVEGDELRLEQVIQNLLQNALKYSPLGGPVVVTLQHAADHACIAVTDHGIGIPSQALPQLFRRFYRAPNVDPKNISGLGIGLYVIRDIITLHGGTIEVASEEGRGSTFTLRLPLADTTPS